MIEKLTTIPNGEGMFATARNPNNEELMDKINELVDVVNELSKSKPSITLPYKIEGTETGRVENDFSTLRGKNE